MYTYTFSCSSTNFHTNPAMSDKEDFYKYSSSNSTYDCEL